MLVEVEADCGLTVEEDPPTKPGSSLVLDLILSFKGGPEVPTTAKVVPLMIRMPSGMEGEELPRGFSELISRLQPSHPLQSAAAAPRATSPAAAVCVAPVIPACLPPSPPSLPPLGADMLPGLRR
ncbi:hypothetical protein CHARACLAT_014460 [Characodon lateralis]|uniref:Uncharacterized protein n=1 Tax=Characodon lateralis TaxID=208331 RepID=A0ABU7ETN9_9TELE|nr:hypothetical protein [Characodon lateralis]